MEKPSLGSGRLDHTWNNRNNSFLRVGVSPSLSTGNQSTAQNQVFGQNSGSRTGVTQSRDLSFTFQHDTIVSDKAFNEFRMQVARRGLHFGFSNLPGGANIAVNIPFANLLLAIFLQDSWRVNRKLTFNYGVRYDVEITPLSAPATAVNAAAEKALGVVEGIPRDYNNVAPRFGLAWDPAGNGKTVIRAGYGLFYDHPLLAVAFDAATADGGRSVQLITTAGTASACGLVTPLCGSGLDSPTNLNGTSIFQGALNALPSMAYLPQQQRFDPFGPNSLFPNHHYLRQTPQSTFPLPILPFTLPLAN